MTSEQADLVRWCHFTGGLGLERLAAEFETTLAEIQQIISTGQALPSGTAKKTVYQFNAPLPPQQTNKRNFALYRLALRGAYD